MKSLNLPLCLILLFVQHVLQAQCNPVPADDCISSNTFCSLSELNGFSCTNSKIPNPTGCIPLCPNGGTSSNAYWWAFVTEGGNVSITVSVSNCVNNNNGIRMGIWADCNCSESVDCLTKCTNNGTFQLNGTLEPCKIYYFFIDGCMGDLCDFTITTTGGSTPTLKPIGKINNDADGKIELCASECSKQLFVNPQPGACTPEYVWTLDGVEQSHQNQNTIDLVFPDEGDFVLCVTAVIGNPSSGSICSQEGPVCATIKVRKMVDKKVGPTYLCFESIPYNWHGEIVDMTGDYRHQFVDVNCCKFDSVVQFQILPEVQPPHVYFIDCGNEFYIDPITRDTFSGCNDDTEVIVKNSTDPNLCDSSYLLTTAFPRISSRWTFTCDADSITYFPTIQVQGECSASYSEEFALYKIVDGSKIFIGNDFSIKIALDDTAKYCYQGIFKFTLGTETIECIKEFCVPFVKKDFFPDVDLIGKNTVRKNDTVEYFQPGVSPLVKDFFTYLWRIEGGHIISPTPEYKDTIQVVWDSANSIGKICLMLYGPCDTIVEKCEEIQIQSGTWATNLNVDQIKIIPNPAKDYFFIAGIIKEIYMIEWYDYSGRPLPNLSGVFENKNSIGLKTDKIPNGVYFLRISNERMNVVRKVVIAR